MSLEDLNCPIILGKCHCDNKSFRLQLGGGFTLFKMKGHLRLVVSQDVQLPNVVLQVDQHRDTRTKRQLQTRIALQRDCLTGLTSEEI